MDADDDLELERENGNRLAAALELLTGCLRPVNGDSHLHIVIGDPKAANQLTVGHVVKGALAAHAAVVKGREGL